MYMLFVQCWRGSREEKENIKVTVSFTFTSRGYFKWLQDCNLVTDSPFCLRQWRYFVCDKESVTLKFFKRSIFPFSDKYSYLWKWKNCKFNLLPFHFNFVLTTLFVVLCQVLHFAFPVYWVTAGESNWRRKREREKERKLAQGCKREKERERESEVSKWFQINHQTIWQTWDRQKGN